jgi:four helix bundle protein
MGARNFEELECWAEARALVNLVFNACTVGKLSTDPGTSDQIRRAALSVMNNIAEGHGRYSRKEFIRFLDIAQSSSLEVKSISYILCDLDYLSADYAANIRTKADRIKNMIRGLIRYLQTHDNPTTY